MTNTILLNGKSQSRGLKKTRKTISKHIEKPITFQSVPVISKSLRVFALLVLPIKRILYSAKIEISQRNRVTNPRQIENEVEDDKITEELNK